MRGMNDIINGQADETEHMCCRARLPCPLNAVRPPPSRARFARLPRPCPPGDVPGAVVLDQSLSVSTRPVPRTVVGGGGSAIGRQSPVAGRRCRVTGCAGRSGTGGAEEEKL